MFFIGVFSSFIPYMIIALIYLAGVAMYTLESRQHNNSQTSNSKQLILQENNLPEPVQKDDCFFFEDYNNNLCLSENLYNSFSESGKELLCFSHPPIRAGILDFSTFSRPPPVISFS